MRKQNKAFTLVELIVVITILAILGTIAFISFQGYSRDSRDSVRISDMNNIEKAMELMLLKGSKLPKPENNINIYASGTLIGYQGEVGLDSLNKLGVNNGGFDPLDDSPYTYVSTDKLNKYQILGYLEQDTTSNNLNILENTYAKDYSSRFPVVKGNNLGVLLNTGSLEPVTTDVDVVLTSDTYVGYISDKYIITGTGYSLAPIDSYMMPYYSSCNDILISENKPLNDGVFKLKEKVGNSFKIYEVYCNMTTDGGGWTLLMKVDGTKPTFLYRSDYWENDKPYNLGEFNHGKTEYKSELFNRLSFDNILLEFDTNGTVNYANLSKTGSSLYDMFNVEGLQPITFGKQNWIDLIPGSSLQTYCNYEGINTQYIINNSPTYQDHPHNARIGITSNNENACDSNDSAVGIGLKQRGNGTISAGSSGVASFGYLYVR